MVHAQSLDVALGQEVEDEAVDLVEDRRVLDPKRDEVVHGEEAAVVDLVGGHLPEGQAEVLAGQKLGQEFPGGLARHLPLAVHRGQGRVEVAAHGLAVIEYLVQQALDEEDLVVALGQVVAPGQVLQAVEDAQELHVVLVLGAELPAQIRDSEAQDQGVGGDGQGQDEVEVAHEEAALVEIDCEFAAHERLAEEAAQEGREQAAAQALQRMLPVDVEGFEVARVRAVLQEIDEHLVVAGHGHVVGHDVQNEAEAELPGSLGQFLEGLAPAQLRAHLGVIADVVAVERAGPGRGDRGEIQVGDAELLQVGQNLAAGGEAEAGMELEPGRWPRGSVGAVGLPHAQEIA